MKISQPNALRSQLIEIRRLQNRIPMSGEVAIPLVIRHHDNDVGLNRKRGTRENSSHCPAHDDGQGQCSEHSHCGHGVRFLA